MSSEFGRILAVDYGTRRVGLAISDPGGCLATPCGTLERTGDRRLAATLSEVCAARQVTRIVVGLPLNMDGSRGPAARAAEAFMDRLRDRVTVPVTAWDERLTTRSAQQGLLRGGARAARRRRLVDEVAAQILLQSYLDAQSAASPGGLQGAPSNGRAP